MTQPRLRWTRVAYQPDLHHAVPPIPLGVVVITDAPEFRVGVVLGRQPRRNSPPPELKSVGVLGATQLDGWVAEVARDALHAVQNELDPFAHLSSKWRWNVFITDPEDVPATGSLLDAAKLLYLNHVGEAFPEDLLRLAEGSQQERSKERRPRRRAWASTHVGFDAEAA